MSEESRTLLGDRYELDQVIGRGGMAEVWRARDVRLGRDVAVKRLRVDLATDPTFQARFRREAQSAAGLNHPNIVATYDTGEEADASTGIHVPYIVMELVEGHTLRDLLREDRRIRPEMALEFTQGVLDALAYSHKAGIIHRDIKPANVMITPGGRVKVMDFGIARAVADTSATMTQTAAVIGTAQYLSPEQARGETVDNRSDVYAAGCLLYELLAGRPPFIGDSPVSVAYQHVREMPVPPSDLDPELTPAMDAIVLKSLAKNPADRYQDAKEMRDDIARLLAGQPVHATTPTVPEPAPEPTAVTQVVQNAGAPAAVGAAAVGAVAAEQGGDTLAGQTGTISVMPEVYEPDAVLDEPKRRNPIVWVIAVLLAALMALGAGVFVYFNRGDGNSGMRPVRSYVGFTETQATGQLKGDGFEVKTTHVNGPDDKTVGYVTKQNPNSGTLLQGSTVTITVNDGPKTLTVPKVLGMTVNEAKKALEDAGFSASKIKTADATAEQESAHLDYQKGQIVTTNPAEGAEVPASQEFTLAVATGKSQVPNLRGMTKDEAEAAAKTAGFQLNWLDRVEDANYVDQVTQQDPSTGTLERTKKIDVALGKEPVEQAPTTIKVPPLTGMTQEAATKLVADSGFTSPVEVREVEVSDQSADGVVVDQTPGADSKQDPGQVITIFVGKYRAPRPAPTPTGQTPTTPATDQPSTPAVTPGSTPS